MEFHLHSSIFLYDVYRDNCTFTFSTELTISVENQVRKVFNFIRAVFLPLYKKGKALEIFNSLWLPEALQQGRIIASSVLLWPGVDFSLRNTRAFYENILNFKGLSSVI